MKRSGLTEQNSNQKKIARTSANGGGAGAGGGGSVDPSLSVVGGGGIPGCSNSVGQQCANNVHDQQQVSGPGANTPASFLHANKRYGQLKSKGSIWDQAEIRIGAEYQAVCPPLSTERKPEDFNERALVVWTPVKDNISEDKLDEYITVARNKYGYSREQAFSMLFWHNHDFERAINDMDNFIPRFEEWTAEDKTLFEQAFQYHGKSFRHISQMLADKSVAQVVRYYYSWKVECMRSGVKYPKKKKVKNVARKEEGGGNISIVDDNKENGVDDNKENDVGDNKDNGVDDNKENDVGDNKDNGVDDNKENDVGDNKDNGVGNKEDGAGGGANSVLTEKKIC